MKKKERTYQGRIPDESWEYVGIVDNDTARFLAYSKETTNNEGDLTGYCYLKLVLEPGKRARKANYWISVRIKDGYIVRNNDLCKMAEHAPILHENLYDFVSEFFM